MSVESKIKQLLERVDAKASLDEADAMKPSASKDTSIKAANAGDASMPKQGGSEDASYEEREEEEENQGAKTAKGIKQNSLTNKGPGAAPNFQTVGDATSVVNQQNSSGNTPVGEEVEEEEFDQLDELSKGTLRSYINKAGTQVLGAAAAAKSGFKFDDKQKAKLIKRGDSIDNAVDKYKKEEYDEEEYDDVIDLSPIFGDDLSEDFKSKATSIFEAAVIARVNAEMEKVASSLEEKYSADVADYKDGIVERIDSYLNYVVENWMQENELALENGLRTEIAEDFMSGLKVLFKEHYIEVPEERYDVIGELQANAEELGTKLDEAINRSVELNKEVTSLKRAAVVEEMSKDLADTEAAKLGKLLEGVDFENESLYREKVSVIKENYFPKKNLTEGQKSVQSQQTLTEEMDIPVEVSTGSSAVSAYANALSRSIKRA